MSGETHSHREPELVSKETEMIHLILNVNISEQLLRGGPVLGGAAKLKWWDVPRVRDPLLGTRDAATRADALVYSWRVPIRPSSSLANLDTGRRQVQKSHHGGVPRVTHTAKYMQRSQSHQSGLCFSATSSGKPPLSPRALSSPATHSDCNCSIHEYDGLFT